MFKTEDILDAARTIRPYLGDLLETESAKEIDGQLAHLLAKANSGQPVENLILELLAAHEATRDWMNRFLLNRQQPEHQRTFSPLPGRVSPLINAPKYVCPQGDYVWYRPRVGTIPPLCPTHNLPLDLE